MSIYLAILTLFLAFASLYPTILTLELTIASLYLTIQRRKKKTELREKSQSNSAILAILILSQL